MISNDKIEQKRYLNVFESMNPTLSFMIFTSILLLLSLIGVLAFLVQLDKGLIVTGLSDRAFWGLYITNFIFFIGISHAGTNIILHGNITSPIVWDVLSISTYLSGSILFLYLPLIPDLAILRDRYKDNNVIRYHFYRVFALNWTGTPAQHKRLERGISIMAILIIPIAVSVHTVVSWIFSMTWRPGWHSTIFGPYFVVGAIFSGIASILIAMAIFRRIYKLHDLITDKQFENLGLLLLAFAMMYLYFTISEFLTAGYTNWEEDAEVLGELFYGRFAWMFWTFLICGLFIPIILLVNPKTRTVKGILIASILVNIGMWVKRFIIIVPTVSAPVVSSSWVIYTPTIYEILITISGFAFFILLYAIFSKIFPIISIWEMVEHDEKENNNTKE
jgi:molybdopterin-containing oxidoreductase family membrane subunit